MRKVFLSILVSLDGYIESPDGGLEWFSEDEDFEQYVTDMLYSIDLMLFGRVAFELLAQYWPTAGTDPSSTPRQVEWARLMNGLPKVVFSKTLQKTEWHNSRIASGDLAQEIAQLKRQPGKDIALFAGAELASACMRLGLLDEYRLILNPIVLGGGKPLFKNVTDRHGLKLLQTRTFSSGAMVLRYEPRYSPESANRPSQS